MRPVKLPKSTRLNSLSHSVDYVLDPNRGIEHSVIDRSIGAVHGRKEVSLSGSTIRNNLLCHTASRSS